MGDKLILNPEAPKCVIYDVINGNTGCLSWNYGHCNNPNFSHNSKCPKGYKSKRLKHPSQARFRHYDIDQEKVVNNGS